MLKRAFILLLSLLLGEAIAGTDAHRILFMGANAPVAQWNFLGGSLPPWVSFTSLNIMFLWD